MELVVLCKVQVHLKLLRKVVHASNVLEVVQKFSLKKNHSQAQIYFKTKEKYH